MEETTALATLTLDTEAMISIIPTFTPDWTGLIEKTCAIKDIASAADRQKAIDAMNSVKAMVKDAEAHFDPLAKALNTVKTEVTGRRGFVVDNCKAEAKRLEGLALAFDAEQARLRRMEEERIRREAQARADAERQRLETEAAERAAKMEAEARAIREAAAIEAAKLAEQGRAEEAAAAQRNAEIEAQQRDAQASEVIEQAIEEAAQPALIPEVIMPDHRPKASVAGASTATVWGQDVRVVDFKALIKAAYENPNAYACYLQVNESALKSHARAVKENFNVPGCVSKPKEQLRSYGSRG